MMDYFTKKYLQCCRDELSVYGFKHGISRGIHAFARVVNDVKQIFVLDKIYGGRVYRVEFSVVPLCARIEKGDIWEGMNHHELRRFEPVAQRFKSWDGWDCDPKSKENAEACVKEAMRFIREHLVPYFERADSCKTALKEVIELELLFDEVRKESLKLQGYEKIAEGKNVIDMLDNTKYYMALKNGDYAFALKSRKGLEQQHVSSFISVSGWLPEESKARRLRDIEELRKEIAMIENEEWDLIQRILRENEEYSREILKGTLL